MFMKGQQGQNDTTESPRHKLGVRTVKERPLSKQRTRAGPGYVRRYLDDEHEP